MKEMTGGQAVVQCLIKSGVKTVFGLPGVQNDWLYNAFYDYRDQIKVLHSRHEQGTAYMALGYYLATGEPAVFNIVPGPGFLNSSAGLATAWGLNAKILCLVGQVPTKVLGKGYGVLHEIKDQRGILASLTKASAYIESIQDIPKVFSRIWSNMLNGRPRPVGLEVAMDMLQSKGEIDLGQYTLTQQVYAPTTEEITKLSSLLEKSKKPLIFVASGAVDAASEVKELAEFIQAPTFSYRTGKGIMPSSHYLSYPTPAAHDLWGDCDLVIGIGTHCRMPMLKWGKSGINYVSINIDESVHNTFCDPILSITADSKLTIQKLNERLREEQSPKPSREGEMRQFAEEWAKKTAYLEPQASYLKAIREVLPEDGILVDELTQVGFASRILWETDRPRTYLSTGHMGTLGWGFMTALGAKVGKPESMVISLAGDGGFMFGVQELATAVQHKIGIIVLLFNNNLFGNVRSMQEQLYDNKVIATDLHNPDFVALAKAFGAHAERVDNVSAMKTAIERAAGRELPTIIEVPVQNDWPSTNRFKALPKLR